MARGLNRVMLIGNLGADPDTRYTATGTCVSNISVATTEGWRDKSGDLQEHTEWHKVVFFGRTAEVVAEYLHKGSQVFVEGRIRTEKWQDQSGADRWTTKVYGDRMQMLGGGSGESRGRPASSSGQRQTRAKEPAPDLAADDFDDDIPF